MSWYKKHRSFWDNPMFANEPFSEREAFDWIIAFAEFEPKKINIKGKPHTLQRGQISHSYRFLADQWKWGLSKVKRYIDKLQEWESISVETGTGQAIITICNYDKYQGQRNESETGAERGRNGSGTNKKESKNLKTEGTNPPAPKGEVVLPECVSREAWGAYCQHRGKKFTANAQRLALGKLVEWHGRGHDPTEIINTAIMNGWKGLYEPKEKGQSNGKPTKAERAERALDEGMRRVREGNAVALPPPAVVRDIQPVRTGAGSLGEHLLGLLGSAGAVRPGADINGVQGMAEDKILNADPCGHPGINPEASAKGSNPPF